MKSQLMIVRRDSDFNVSLPCMTTSNMFCQNPLATSCESAVSQLGQPARAFLALCLRRQRRHRQLQTVQSTERILNPDPATVANECGPNYHSHSTSACERFDACSDTGLRERKDPHGSTIIVAKTSLLSFTIKLVSSTHSYCHEAVGYTK